MRKIVDRLYGLSTRGHAVAASLVFVLFVGVVLPWQARESRARQGDAGSADLSFAYSTEELRDMASAYGAEGRRAYVRARMTFDIVWPLAYSYFFLSIIGLALRHASPAESRWRLLLPLALAPFAFDMLENGTVAYVFSVYPSRAELASRLASAATSLKWSTMALVHVLAIAAGIAAAAAGIRRRVAMGGRRSR